MRLWAGAANGAASTERLRAILHQPVDGAASAVRFGAAKRKPVFKRGGA